MPLQAFAPSRSLSMGVELELQLVSLSDHDLAAASPDMLELLGRKPFPGVVTPEITESMIEIATSIQYEHTSLLSELRSMRTLLVKAADSLNVGICGGGTHPFQLWSERRIFDKPRFKEVSELYGYLTKQFTIFGQHVHIGCSNGDEAMYLLHSLSRYVPHFIALSGSSPFVQGNDTRFSSARLNSVFAFPLSGRAPFTLRWSDFERDYFSKMELTGVVKSMKDFYWDIRPKPEYGTIELRVCDTPLSVERAAALACYLQALCKYLLEQRESMPREDDYLVYNYNRFQACRFGLDGVLIHPQTYEQIPLREDILSTLRRIQPQSDSLNSAEAMERIYRISHQGSDAHHLRKTFMESGSLQAMVAESISLFAADAV
jgi:glutamate---cysteine ligase / carboxylate-amine ligase